MHILNKNILKVSKQNLLCRYLAYIWCSSLTLSCRNFSEFNEDSTRPERQVQSKFNSTWIWIGTDPEDSASETVPSARHLLFVNWAYPPPFFPSVKSYKELWRHIEIDALCLYHSRCAFLGSLQNLSWGKGCGSVQNTCSVCVRAWLQSSLSTTAVTWRFLCLHEEKDPMSAVDKTRRAVLESAELCCFCCRGAAAFHCALQGGASITDSLQFWGTAILHILTCAL